MSHTNHNNPIKQAPKANTITGRISINSKAVGFVPNIDKNQEDIMIETANLNKALHGDEVEVAILPKILYDRQTGEVVQIITRAKEEFVGTMEQAKNIFFLIPDDRKMYTDIFISPSNAKDAKHGDKVLVKLIDWSDKKKNPEGKVLTVIGKKGEHNTEMKSIVYEKGFNMEFPPKVEEEGHQASLLGKPIPEEEIKKRTDFRGTLTFTIDPITAKDFDDAISYKKLPNGNYEIGVHIADVSHYVRPGTELDKEAAKRAFSVYLVDRTIPMLPEGLSNDICSLNPNEDRLAFGAVFEITSHAEVVKRWFGKTVINSDKRFSYEDAQDILNNKAGLYYEELDTLNKIAKIFQKQKADEGAINFEQEEVRFELDANGVPLRVYKKERFDTHKLVEEFMLLANREVAEYLYEMDKKKKNKALGLMYRIHDVPKQEKVKELAIFLKALGYTLKITEDGEVTAKDLNMLLKQVEGKAEEGLVKTAAVRSMSKAIYSTQNIGHFGLAFEYYTHFTSPIRRYPDLLVHRILFKYLNNEEITENELAYFEKMAAQSTEREIAAAEAERTSIKYKQVEYMMNKVGQEFDGIISGVTEWGVYVEENETKAEGMVRVKDMTDDVYSLDMKNYAVVGTKTKKKYALGDRVRVKITKADLEKKTLDYVFVDTPQVAK